jgi:hypothetical protein
MREPPERAERVGGSPAAIFDLLVLGINDI